MRIIAAETLNVNRFLKSSLINAKEKSATCNGRDLYRVVLVTTGGGVRAVDLGESW